MLSYVLASIVSPMGDFPAIDRDYFTCTIPEVVFPRGYFQGSKTVADPRFIRMAYRLVFV